MADKAPNILWICTDSQRWDTLGCYGNTFVRSPNLDRLAQDGMLFEHCYAQNPLCTPSRGCFLTGRYPSCNGLRQNGQNIRPSEVLVTRLLAEQGWICGLSGKLHLGACNRRFTLGDRWWELPNDLQVVQGVEQRIQDGYAEFHWDHGPSPQFRSSAYNRWVQAQGARIETPAREDFPDLCHGMPPHLHQTFWCTQKAIEFIRAYEGYAHPWLFSVNIFDPHFVNDPPDAYFDAYRDRLDEIPLPVFKEGELENKPYYHEKQHNPSKYGRKHYKDLAGVSSDNPRGEPLRHRALRAGYWAMCDFIDVQVGRLLEALERTGQRKNTIVIFTSDHGELLGDHGMYIKGPLLYDCSIRVPLIVNGPGVRSGLRSAAMVELGDLAPTVLDIAGLPRHPGMQMQSLWPLLNGTTDTHRADVYCEYYNANPDDPKVYLSMIRTPDWKLVNAHGLSAKDGGELYDLRNDLRECRNLWLDPAYAAIKLDLLKRLSDRQAFAGTDPLPKRIGIF